MYKSKCICTQIIIAGLTDHSQIAKLLVLWAALSCTKLNGLVIRSELKALLEQIISFYKEHRGKTAADKNDLDVIERMVQSVGPTC